MDQLAGAIKEAATATSSLNRRRLWTAALAMSSSQIVLSLCIRRIILDSIGAEKLALRGAMITSLHDSTS